MLLDDRLFYKSYEIIGGEKFMAPAAPVYHGSIILDLAYLFKDYFRTHKNGYVFSDNIDVHLPNGDIFQPDLVVVTAENSNIINWKSSIYGVPDMVAEVLSKSTRHKDLTIKKDAYELNGFKEYWIIDPLMKVVDVYLLRNGKYYLDGEYILYDDEKEFDLLTDEEKAKVKSEIKVSIFEGLTIKLEDIFTWGF